MSFSFSDAEAHPDDPLPHHLHAVASNALASMPSAPARVRTAIILQGLFHDAGKATPWFQAYLHGRLKNPDERTHHSRLGAVLAHHFFQAGDMNELDPEWLRWATVIGIAKHHGNFAQSLSTTYTTLRHDLKDSEVIRDQLEQFDAEGFREWLVEELQTFDIDADAPSFDQDEVLRSVQNYFPKFSNPFENSEDGFDFLASYGALLGADKIHAAHPYWSFDPPNLLPNLVDAYKDQEFGTPTTEMDQLRQDIAEEITETLEDHPDERLYTLTAPTGSGKTLAGLRAALQIKERENASRIVYALPFTSVIDQNTKVIEKVLEANNIEADSRALLPHHHLTDLTYRENETKIVDGADLLVETWQSELVVTTFHQLLYTLFTSRNRNLKRVSALENAVVLLDEVQAIPYKYWRDVREMMELCSQRLNTTFVLMTATMPLILPREGTVELLPSFRDRYKSLSRTRVRNYTNQELSLDEFAEDLVRRGRESPNESIIVILNRRKAVQHVYDAVSETSGRHVAMLSTDLTPRDRKRILDELEDPFTLVTTQLIEAGVDISAGTVIRDAAPLDSIIQSAGRCNRNAERDRGNVEIVRLVDDKGRPLTNWVYSTFLVDKTLKVIEGRETVEEAEFHELARRYYELLTKQGESTSIMSFLGDGAIHKLDDKEEGLQLIEDDYPRQAHFIIQDQEDQDVWDRYMRVQKLADPFERRKEYRQMRREFMERVVNYPAKEEPSEEVIPVQLDSGYYDPERGLLENVDEASFEIW